LGTDGITVNADIEGAQNPCPVVSHDACPFTISTDGRQVGNTDVQSTVFIDSVQAGVQAPVGVIPSQEIAVEPASLEIHQPAYGELNSTWLAINDSRPDALKSYFAFESRPKRDYWSDGHSTPGNWGLFLTYYPSSRIGPYDSVPLVSFCWEPCDLENSPYLHATQDDIQPSPNNVFLRDYRGGDISTDQEVNDTLEGASQCMQMCNTGAAQPSLTEAGQTYRNVTPSVGLGFQYNRSDVIVDLDGHAQKEKHSSDHAPRGPPQKRTDEQTAHDEPQSNSSSTFDRSSSEATSGRKDSTSFSSKIHSASVVPAAPRLPPGGSPALLLAVTAGAIAGIAALALWVLYHRLDKRTGLDQGTRQKIHEAIQRQAGLRASDLAIQLGMDHSTVQYHLRKLHSWGYVHPGEGTRPRYYPFVQSAEERRITEVLSQPTARAVLTVLQQEMEADHSRLAAATGFSLATVGRSAKLLETVGLAHHDPAAMIARAA
jgi:DNA-binding transcriptional ArsR family regulator